MNDLAIQYPLQYEYFDVNQFFMPLIICMTLINYFFLLFILFKINNLQKNTNLDFIKNIYNTRKNKIEEIKNNNNLCVKYLKSGGRHFSAVVKEFDIINNRARINFHDCVLPYIIDCENLDDRDNGWVSIDKLYTYNDIKNGTIKDPLFTFPISMEEYASFKINLYNKNVLFLLKIETIRGKTFYQVGKSTKSLIETIKSIQKHYSELSTYLSKIIPIDTMVVNDIKEAEFNLATSFDIRFNQSEDFEFMNVYHGEEHEMLEEFNSFFTNHPQYSIL